MTVWKFELGHDETRVREGKVVLVSSDERTFKPVVWVEHELRDSWMTLTFVGTGHPVEPGWLHVGSCIAAGGALVWHVYRVDGPRGMS